MVILTTTATASTITTAAPTTATNPSTTSTNPSTTTTNSCFYFMYQKDLVFSANTYMIFLNNISQGSLRLRN